MFASAANFNADISSWDTSSATEFVSDKSTHMSTSKHYFKILIVFYSISSVAHHVFTI
jgi:surface protein